MAKKKLTLEDMLVPVDEIPYEVPENWCWTRLKFISSIISKGTTPKGGKSAYIDSGVKFLRVENINDYGYIDLDNIKYISEDTHLGFLKRSILFENDILISIAGTLGKTAIVREDDLPLNTNQAIAFIRLTDKEKILPKYVKLFLSSPQVIKELLSQTKVTAIPNLTLEIVGDCKIPIPPLAEQERIVNRIESLFDKVDRAAELVDEARDGFEKRRAAILEMAFSGELTKKWREENRNEVINIKSNNNYKGYNIPDNWMWVTIDDIMIVKGGKRLPKGEKLLDENTGYPYIRAGDLKQGTVITDNIQYISKEVYEKIKNYYVNEGDVYITIVGACIGDVGIVPKELDGANLTENAAKLCNKGSVNSKFISRYLSSNFAQMMLKSDIASATLGKLSLTKIKNFIVPIPPIEEQNEIVSILDKLLENEDMVKESIDIVDNIDIIKKSILAKAFRGELGSNDFNEESSIALINDILNS